MPHMLEGLTVSQGIYLGFGMGLILAMVLQLHAVWTTSEAREFLKDFDWIMNPSRTFKHLEGFLAKGISKSSLRTWNLAFLRAINQASDYSQTAALSSILENNGQG